MPKFNIGTQGFYVICMLKLISQNKSLVNPNFQEMLSFAYGWHITSQSKGLSNSLSINQRSELLKHAALLRVLSARLFRQPRHRSLKHLLRRCLSQKVQKGLTLQHLFSLSSQFVVMNPVQGNRLFVLKFGLLLPMQGKIFPFEDVDFTDFDPSFRDFLKELALVSEIVRLFRQKNFVLEMIIYTMHDARNLEQNSYWLKYVWLKYPNQDLISFWETFSRLTKLYSFEVCPLYDCCVNKKHLEHCGLCPELPCQTFTSLRDPALSDEEAEKALQKRQKDLKLRKKIGTENWLKNKQ